MPQMHIHEPPNNFEGSVEEVSSLLLCRYGILFDPIPGIVIFLAHPQKWPCACLVLGKINVEQLYLESHVSTYQSQC